MQKNIQQSALIKGKLPKSKIIYVINLMREKNINQILIFNPFDIFYLINRFIDPGDRFFCLYLNSNGTGKLFANKIFKLEDEIINGVDKIIYSDGDDPIKIFSDQTKKYCEEKMWVDKNLPARFLLPIINKAFDIKKIFISDILEQARLIKTIEEINFMRESSELNDKVMGLLIKNIREGQSELELEAILRRIKKDLNIEKFSFEPIIAFGKNAAEPHHVPNQTKLKPGDCIVIDIGFIKNNYCSDMTRTFFYKFVSEFDKKIYDIVLQANLLAIEKIKPGIKFSEIDLAARNFITQNGYEKNFIHTTGHSIGLECHEFGTVSFRNQNKIKENMIFSVEPGIYLENKIGVRIEDLILVNNNGCEVLNKFDKQIKVIN